MAKRVRASHISAMNIYIIKSHDQRGVSLCNPPLLSPTHIDKSNFNASLREKEIKSQILLFIFCGSADYCYNVMQNGKREWRKGRLMGAKGIYGQKNLIRTIRNHKACRKIENSRKLKRKSSDHNKGWNNLLKKKVTLI